MARSEYGRFRSDGSIRLRSEMKRRKLTQYAVAQMLGERQMQVHRYVWGDAEVPLDVAVRIEKLFGIPCASFVPRRRISDKIRRVS